MKNWWNPMSPRMPIVVRRNMASPRVGSPFSQKRLSRNMRIIVPAVMR